MPKNNPEQCQIPPGFPQLRIVGRCDPAPHKQEAHQNKEHAVGVDGGDAGLGQVHEVKGKEGGAAEGHNRLAEEVFQEDIEQGHHENAEEGAHEPPAEGGQAEELDAQAHDQLAQRRMGDLIG